MLRERRKRLQHQACPMPRQRAFPCFGWKKNSQAVLVCQGREHGRNCGCLGLETGGQNPRGLPGTEGALKQSESVGSNTETRHHAVFQEAIQSLVVEFRCAQYRGPGSFPNIVRNEVRQRSPDLDDLPVEEGSIASLAFTTSRGRMRQRSAVCHAHARNL